MMAVCTILSRAAASVLTAQVNVEKPGRGKLSFSYGGNGTVVPCQEKVIFLWPGQQVEWAADVGSTVKAGECLIQFRMEYLQQAIQSKQAELTQLELQVQQQQISARGTARVPSAERAQQALQEAQNRLQEAMQKEAQAQEEYDRSAGGISTGSSGSWSPGGAVTGNTIGRTGRMNNGNGTNADIRPGENANSGTADVWPCGNPGSETADPDMMPGANGVDQPGTNPGDSLGGDSTDLPQDNFIDESNDRSAREQELKSALEQAKADVEAASQALTQAQTDYHFALKEDAAQNINEDNAAQSVRLGVQSLEVQADQARQALDQLTAYQNAGGKIYAEQDCTVLTSGVTAGAFTTGAEVLITGSGGWKLKGIADAKDKEKLKAGVEAEIRLGAGKKRTVRIESVAAEQSAGSSAGENSASSSLQPCWYTRLPENTTAENGNTFTWTVNASSDQEYEQLIPLGALREDTAGAYCLILSEEKTMLGTVQTAKRVPVTVLEKDSQKAAVTSTLKETDRIIASSEKYVEEGDRVRLKE